MLTCSFSSSWEALYYVRTSVDKFQQQDFIVRQAFGKLFLFAQSYNPALPSSSRAASVLKTSSTLPFAITSSQVNFPSQCYTHHIKLTLKRSHMSTNNSHQRADLLPHRLCAGLWRRQRLFWLRLLCPGRLAR